MKLRTVITTTLMILALAGCATSTSRSFKIGAAEMGPALADEATQYVQADDHLGEPDRSVRLGAALQLQGATADRTTVTYDGVAAAWGGVREFYRAYVAADNTLADDHRAWILHTADVFDGLLSAERKRREALAPWLRLTAPPVPPPMPPLPAK